MNKFFAITLFLLLFLCVSCENKVNFPEKEISDEDEIQDEDTDTVQELLFNLKVEANEKNSLSCRLTFSTSDERKTFVKYYSDTHKGYKISEEIDGSTLRRLAGAGSSIWNLLTPTTTCSPLSTSS